MRDVRVNRYVTATQTNDFNQRASAGLEKPKRTFAGAHAQLSSIKLDGLACFERLWGQKSLRVTADAPPRNPHPLDLMISLALDPLRLLLRGSRGLVSVHSRALLA